MGARGDRATGYAGGTDQYKGNTSPFQPTIASLQSHDTLPLTLLIASTRHPRQKLESQLRIAKWPIDLPVYYIISPRCFDTFIHLFDPS